MKRIATCVCLFALVILLLIPAYGQYEETLADGWTKVLGITTHEGSPYPSVVTDEVSSGWDFDNDGNLEILVLTDHSNPQGGGTEYPTGCSLWLYEATVSGYELVWSWWDTTLYTGGASFPTHAVGDLDGDENPELLLGIPYGTGNPPDGSNPARFYVWEADANGLPAWDGTTPPEPTATWDFNVSVGTNTRPSCMAVDDIDGDGQQEVAMGFRAFSDAAANDAMMIFSLNGQFFGTLTQWTIEMIDSTSNVGSTYAAAITDLDNDGNKEAFFSTDYGSIFESNGADTYIPYVEKDFQSKYNIWTVHGISTFDMDGDEDLELIIGKTDGSVVIIDGITDLATADSNNVFVVDNLSPTGCRGLAVGYFDDDLKPDIMMAGNYGSSVWWMEYNGTGSITDSASYTKQMVYQADTSGSIRSYSVAFGGAYANGGISDLNKNGNPELVIGHEDGDSTATHYVVILENTGAVAIEYNPGALTLHAYKLSQNYPNPFNPTTVIPYRIPKESHVNLSIYNIRGELVKTLVDEYQGVNEYNVTWNGTDNLGKKVATGTYIYQLNVNGIILNKTMTYVK